MDGVERNNYDSRVYHFELCFRALCGCAHCLYWDNSRIQLLPVDFDVPFEMTFRVKFLCVSEKTNKQKQKMVGSIFKDPCIWYRLYPFYVKAIVLIIIITYNHTTMGSESRRVTSVRISLSCRNLTV